MLFNVLSFMSDKLLTVGNTVAALDELYIWLSNPTAIEYILSLIHISSSSRRSSELSAVPFMSLDLTPGHGNLLGESYWERFPTAYTEVGQRDLLGLFVRLHFSSPLPVEPAP